MKQLKTFLLTFTLTVMISLGASYMQKTVYATGGQNCNPGPYGIPVNCVDTGIIFDETSPIQDEHLLLASGAFITGLGLFANGKLMRNSIKNR